MLKAFLLIAGLVGCVAFLRDLGPRLFGGSDQGPLVSYFGDGTKKSSFTMEDGVRSGPAAEWHASGAKECEGRYADGRREGPWTFWHADGSLDQARSGLYRHGERVGPPE